MRVDVAATAEEAAAGAASHVAAELRKALAARGLATLALSGGSSPARLFAGLAREPLDWLRVHVFQVDERFAPTGDAARNLVSIERALVAGGQLPGANLHPMPVDDADAGAAAARYERSLVNVAGRPPVLDVVHLGLGADGHTASLFPGDPAVGGADGGVAVTATQAGYRRMTLTLPVINAAATILWFVTGAAKAAVLGKLIEGNWEAPAGQVARRQAVVFADTAAQG